MSEQTKRYLLSELLEGMVKIEQHGGVWNLSGLPDQVVKELNSCVDWVQDSAISGLRGLGALLVWADFLDEPMWQDYSRETGHLIQLLGDTFEVSKQAQGDLSFIRHRCKQAPDGTWNTPKDLFTRVPRS